MASDNTRSVGTLLAAGAALYGAWQVALANQPAPSPRVPTPSYPRPDVRLFSGLDKVGGPRRSDRARAAAEGNAAMDAARQVAPHVFVPPRQVVKGDVIVAVPAHGFFLQGRVVGVRVVPDDRKIGLEVQDGRQRRWHVLPFFAVVPIAPRSRLAFGAVLGSSGYARGVVHGAYADKPRIDILCSGPDYKMRGARVPAQRSGYVVRMTKTLAEVHALRYNREGGVDATIYRFNRTTGLEVGNARTTGFEITCRINPSDLPER